MADAVVEHMLTTIDNPWNPFTQYDEWLAFDRSMGRDTPGYLARICKSSMELSDRAQSQAIEDAIDEIVKLNILGIYRKVSSTTE